MIGDHAGDVLGIARMNRRQLLEADAGSGDAPVTRWLNDLRRGDEAAAGRLWDESVELAGLG